MRDLGEVIDKLGAVDPEIAKALNPIGASLLYSPPELLRDRWWEVANVLNAQFKDHQKSQEIAKIFSGE